MSGKRRKWSICVQVTPHGICLSDQSCESPGVQECRSSSQGGLFEIAVFTLPSNQEFPQLPCTFYGTIIAKNMLS